MEFREQFTCNLFPRQKCLDMGRLLGGGDVGTAVVVGGDSHYGCVSVGFGVSLGGVGVGVGIGFGVGRINTISVDNDNDFECVSVCSGHTQDVKNTQWHPTQEVTNHLLCHPIQILWISKIL
eukprot:TRINITY_DN6421_c0_g1_i12.p2 TRINITY_DN6421_c0_g1~~TRINITY_DN6421_c0_g1_i12.p2  ORF type:complete len:122 (-),score=22.18 TRINITY_DN6421_c0_g1_i12:323-688(-)